MNHQQQYFNFNNFISLTGQNFYPIPKHSPKPDTNNNASSVEETFSRKVFVGGLPLSVMEYEIKQHFEKFGPLRVEWESRPLESSYTFKMKAKQKGYAFLIYFDEASVHRLLSNCTQHEDHYYMYISGRTFVQKQIQIRPWRLTDKQYMPNPSNPLDPHFTVFVGAIPRPIKASELANVLAKQFGPVNYVEIDVDSELNYPKGAARINFCNYKSYVAAMTSRSIVIPHYSEGQKKVDIKPYTLSDQMCDECMGQLCQGRYAPYFCADLDCLQYYCEICWDRLHYGAAVNRNRQGHRPFMKLGEQIGFGHLHLLPHNMLRFL